jgi:hypothetical protein
MIGDGVDPLVGVLARLAVPPRLVMGALNHVEQVRVDAVADEALPEIVPVDSPGIGRAVGERLPHVPHRMIAIHAAVEAHPLFVGRAGFADHRPVGPPVRAVKPAVGSPGEGVGQVVGVGVVAEAVEQHFRRPVGNVVPVAVGNEIEVRRRHDPGPAEADLNPGHIVQPLSKNTVR